MNNTLEYRFTVLPSMCDHRARMSLTAMMDLFMDAATLHASQLKIGAADILKRRLFWLTTKTMITVSRYPDIMEELTVTTWPLKAEGLRCYRDYTISAGNEILVRGKSQWALWNLLTSSLYPLEKVFPKQLEFRTDDCCPQEFRFIDHDFSTSLLLGQYAVGSGDIDLGGHSNNVSYMRHLLNLFSASELDKMKITHLEINFLHQCKEKEQLSCYVRKNDDGYELAAIKENGKAAVLVTLS